MSLNYTQYVNSLANLMVVSPSDANFQLDLPNIIDDAELRIYRDLDPLQTVTTDASSALTAGNRNFTLPSANGTFFVVNTINVVSPAGTANPENGTRNQLTPTSVEVLNALWPSVSGSTIPSYFAMVTQFSGIVGAWPDAAYQVEVQGTIRPASLSSTNVTTILSVYWPDLLLAASMVRAAGYLKNYGAAVDDPKQGVTWEGHYQSLLKSADVEEMRKKFEGPGWSSKTPSPIVTPPRT